MAVYPAGNPGVYPLVPSTPVGQWRLASGDTQSTPYNPVQAGFQDYTYASDAEILQFLALADDSVQGAIGYWYLQLSGAAAREARTVADYDLRISTEKRAADLRATAEFWLSQAGIAGGGEAFEVAPVGEREDCWPPELAPFPVIHHQSRWFW